jgi:K(+)-stimulated pyrophosphate-energized sodium pump
MKTLRRTLLTAGLFLLGNMAVFASEADLAIPDLHRGAPYTMLGGITPFNLLFYGALVICGTLGISLFLRHQIKKIKAHESMLKVAETIFQTCRTYLLQQGKFLVTLFIFIAVAMAFYFLVLKGQSIGVLAQVLLFSVVGMAGSYTVACIPCREAMGCGKHSAACWYERRTLPHIARTCYDGYHSSVCSA